MPPRTYIRKSLNENRCDLKDQTSTFNIPDALWSRFRARLGDFESMESYLIYLVGCSRNVSASALPRGNPLTAQYQARDLDLHRYDFKVDAFLWHEFKCQARFRGFSMCAFFIILLELDLAGALTPKKFRNRSNGVPTYSNPEFRFSEEFWQKKFKIVRSIGPPGRRNQKNR